MKLKYCRDGKSKLKSSFQKKKQRQKQKYSVQFDQNQTKLATALMAIVKIHIRPLSFSQN